MVWHLLTYIFSSEDRCPASSHQTCGWWWWWWWWRDAHARKYSGSAACSFSFCCNFTSERQSITKRYWQNGLTNKASRGYSVTSFRFLKALAGNCGTLIVTACVCIFRVGKVKCFYRKPPAFSIMYHRVWQEAFNINRKRSRRGQEGVFVPQSLTACHFQLRCAITGRIWPSLEQRGAPCKCYIRITSSSSLVNIVFPLSIHLPFNILTHEALPPGPMCACKHASFCFWLKRNAGWCGRKSLVVLLEGRPWLSPVSHK